MTTDPVTTLPPEVLLDVLGPSWQIMTLQQRAAYANPGGRAYDPLLDGTTEELDRLLDRLAIREAAFVHEEAARLRRQHPYRLPRRYGE